MTALLCIVLFIIIYQIVFTILDDVEHFEYSKSISKYEGKLSFFKTLFWTYVLPKEFLVISPYYTQIDVLNYSLSDLANIEMVCRNAINNVKGYRVLMHTPNRIRFEEPGDVNSSQLTLHNTSIVYNSTERFVLPPYYVRLILKALQNKSIDVLDRL